MKNKYIFVVLMLVAILCTSFWLTGLYVSCHQAEQDEDFVIVTSFYPMYIATLNVVGDVEGVTLKNLSEPQTGCLHDFQLTPADMKLLSTADVFVINGGGIEAFIEDVAKQYPDLVIINASEGLDLLCAEDHNHEEGTHDADDAHEGHDHGDVNAHAWMSVKLYRQQVKAIATALAQVDLENSASYLANKNAYDSKLSELQQLQEEVRQFVPEHSEVILLHSGYEYLSQEYDLEVAFCMDLDEERQTSAGEVARVIENIQEHGVKYIFAEELYAKDMCNLIQQEVDVEVIYLDPLTRGEYDADSYLKAMRGNIEKLKDAIR